MHIGLQGSWDAKIPSLKSCRTIQKSFHLNCFSAVGLRLDQSVCSEYKEAGPPARVDVTKAERCCKLVNNDDRRTAALMPQRQQFQLTSECSSFNEKNKERHSRLFYSTVFSDSYLVYGKFFWKIITHHFGEKFAEPKSEKKKKMFSSFDVQIIQCAHERMCQMRYLFVHVSLYIF